MSFRLQRITTNYPAYLSQFYAQRPDLVDRPYADQHAALMADGFGWADFWSVALGKLGYETDEVIANAAPLQTAWAAEHGLMYDTLLDITATQIKAFRPDVLFVNDYTTFSAPFLRHVRDECTSIRLVLGWCGAPYSDPSVFHAYDIVLSNIPELVDDFHAQGHTSRHLHHAFEPRILERIDTQAPPTLDFVFIGSITKGGQFHNERARLLLQLVQSTDLQLFAPVQAVPSRQRLANSLRQFAYDAVQTVQAWGVPDSLLARLPAVRQVLHWQQRPQLPRRYGDPRLARRAQPPCYGRAMYQQLHDSRVALNTHIDISSRAASNMRLYEATGVGTCLLTDWKANLPDLFEPDVEVVTYRSAEECAEKARYLLDHDCERQAVAAAGQRRTLRDHTFTQRAEQLDHLIRDALQ